MTSDLELVDRLLQAGDVPRAIAQLRPLFEQQPTLSVARSIISRLAASIHATPTSAAPAKRRIWFLRSYTLEPLFPLLQAAALLEGLDLQLRAGDFNAYVQEILQPGSPLYEFDPDVVFLAVQTRDLVPQLWDLATGEAAPDLTAQLERAQRDLQDWLGTLRARSRASIVVCDFAQPIQPSDGMLDEQLTDGQSALIRRLNQHLRDFAAQTPGVYVLGFDALVARCGRLQFFDERKWLTARMPFAARSLWPMAKECLGVVLALTGTTRKAVVVDLDNTLWGGVVGEDGADGIVLGSEYPGAAYQALQRVLLGLYRRGIILALASKNNAADALEVLEKHPGMLLRPQHFSAVRLNWEPKSQSLRAIAAELKIGTDALLFIDDNPAEREEVRRDLPEVLVVDLPSEPMDFAAAVREQPTLQRLRLAAEDRDRARHYSEQRARVALQSSAGTLDDYYYSLAMTLDISRVQRAQLARASQLTQKTNQFNVTTRRYDEAQVAAMLTDSSARIYGCSVRDRFGDNGLVGLAIVYDRGPAWEIDTLLLSCRVIGRTVETGLLCELAREARAAGARHLRGWFVPTAKNQPAADFYASHGFEPIEKRDAATLWELDLVNKQVEWPRWLNRSGDSATQGEHVAATQSALA